MPTKLLQKRSQAPASGAVLYVGAVPSPRFTLLPTQIQKLAGKSRPIWSSYFFSFGKRINGLGDEGADGAMLPCPASNSFGLRMPPGPHS